MGIAFRTDIEFVTVGEQEQVFTNLFIGQKQVRCGFLEGYVVCETDPAFPGVPNALVKAINLATGEDFFGLTDDDGFYAICVPAGDYVLIVFCCAEDCCEPVGCTCNCNGPTLGTSQKTDFLAQNKIYQAVMKGKK
jgi:hypothetical protein